MDKQGSLKKIPTLVGVSVLTATLASLLMITSNVFDISLAYATTAADAQGDQMDQDSTQLPLPTADAKGDQMDQDSTQLPPPISDTKDDQIGEDSTQLPDAFNSQQNEQPDCIIHCYNVQDDTQ
jgi:hypothetical protein